MCVSSTGHWCPLCDHLTLLSPFSGARTSLCQFLVNYMKEDTKPSFRAPSPCSTSHARAGRRLWAGCENARKAWTGSSSVVPSSSPSHDQISINVE